MKHVYTFFSLVVIVMTVIGCQSDFLDERPDKSLVVPKTLSDMQALLDNSAVMNISPGISDLSTDDFRVSENAWVTLSNLERNAYTWQRDLFLGQPSSEWSYPYRQVFYANLVLEELPRQNNGLNLEKQNQLQGAALFYRAMAFYQLLQFFAPHYIPGKNDDQPGIPLRLTTRLEQPVSRQSLKECYHRIKVDLTASAALLPELPDYKSKPSRAASYALLARVNLLLGDYQSALAHADSTWAIHHQLLDYNHRDLSPKLPAFPAALPNGNTEVLFHSFKTSYSYATLANVYIDANLVGAYDPNDLRKQLFLLDRGSGNFTFRGSYNASLDQFSGLALDEVILIHAESLARMGKLSEAIDQLNLLLVNRYKKGTFIPVTMGTQSQVLDLIISERRKQLLGRGLRWSDLRRLNAEADYQVTLQREIGGNQYVLPANHPNYVFPIPDNEIVNSGITQNPRQ